MRIGGEAGGIARETHDFTITLPAVLLASPFASTHLQPHAHAYWNHLSL